jgi:hypothetical protein
MATFQHCRILVNRLADSSHQHGQVVLRAIAHGREVTISFGRGSYLIHDVTGQGKQRVARLVDECGSVDDARGVALTLLQLPPG